MEKDLARFIDASSDDLDLVEAINKYAIDYLNRDRITDVLNEWLADDLISNDKSLY